MVVAPSGMSVTRRQPYSEGRGAATWAPDLGPEAPRHLFGRNYEPYLEALSRRCADQPGNPLTRRYVRVQPRQRIGAVDSRQPTCTAGE